MAAAASGPTADTLSRLASNLVSMGFFGPAGQFKGDADKIAAASTSSGSNQGRPRGERDGRATARAEGGMRVLTGRVGRRMRRCRLGRARGGLLPVCLKLIVWLSAAVCCLPVWPPPAQTPTPPRRGEGISAAGPQRR